MVSFSTTGIARVSCCDCDIADFVSSICVRVSLETIGSFSIVSLCSMVSSNIGLMSVVSSSLIIGSSTSHVSISDLSSDDVSIICSVPGIVCFCSSDFLIASIDISGCVCSTKIGASIFSSVTTSGCV